MQSTPLFSVVIAAFNASATIEAAVASALAQSEPDFEVVVIDDGSDDDTGELVAQFSDPRVRLLTQENRGAAAARNAGIAAARGDYVAFLDSDDLWLPRYLELARDAVRGVPDVGLAYTDAYAFDNLTGRVRRQSAMHWMRPPIPPPTGSGEFLAELIKRNFVYNSTTVPRRVLVEVGGFAERWRTSEDYHLWLKIILRGHRAVRIPGQQALYRMHPAQKSRNLAQVNQDLVGIFEALEREETASGAHRAMLVRARRKFERELLIEHNEAGLANTARRLRHVLGWVRQRAGLTDSWYKQPPSEIAAGFPDLTRL